MKPKHYDFKIEPINAIEDWDLNFNLGNVIKYIARAKHKGSEIEDLKKALYYLEREIDSKGDETKNSEQQTTDLCGIAQEIAKSKTKLHAIWAPRKIEDDGSSL